MDAEMVAKVRTELKRKPGDSDFLHEDVKSCKYLKVSERCETYSNEEETCQGSNCRVPVQRRVSTFHKSGVPCRFLYYEKGKWSDFPQDLIPSLVESFVAQKSHIRFSIQNRVYVLSFVCMIQLNLRTGFARSIAWIDRNGELFKPAKCIEQNCSGLHVKSFDGRDLLALDSVRDNPGSRNVDGSLSTVTCGLTTSCSDFSILGDKIFNLTEDDHDFSFARDMLLSGFSSSSDISVLQIYKCSHSSLWGHARLQAFKIREQITNSTRGDANIRYAWHGTSKEGILGIIRHGFGQPRVAKNGDAFGVGVYLAPENASHVSAMYSDLDENDEQHILLCKVIMGRMEQVPLGSEQFHPSNEEFDSGVDDCMKPKRYIIWSTHMNTHILPQFIISFKLPTITREMIATSQRKEPSLQESMVFAPFAKGGCDNVPDAHVSTYSDHDHMHQCQESYKAAEQDLCEMQADSCTSSVLDAEMVASCPIQWKGKPTSDRRFGKNPSADRPGSCNVPHSPWISFPELFPMLESKLEPQAMIVLQKLHMKFQVGRLPRNLFVKLMRRMLGDDFLRECIKNRPAQTVPTCDTHSLNR